MPENTENHDLITTAQEAVDPKEVVEGIYLGRTADGATKVIDLRDDLAKDLERPKRKTGTYAVSETHSFIDYLAKHGRPETELWGNAKAGTVKAVINAHRGAENPSPDAGWGDHTVTLNLPFSPDWTDWTKHDGSYMSQAAFAEFIEDHLPNFVSPTGADMLELAQTFQATTGVQFASSQRLKSGETQILYAEETTASAGKKGNLTVPDTFEIGMQVYDRGAAYKLTARLRYRITGGNLVLAYKLVRPTDVLNAAFDEVLEQIGSKAKREVWLT